MAQFSANLTMLFTELSFLDRFRAASRAGFRGVEYVSPYEFYPGDISDRLKANRLKQVLFNLPVGNWNAGERGIAIFSDRREEFRESVATAIRYAKALECPQVNCLAGIAPEGSDPAELRSTLVENLRYASTELRKAGIRLLVEAINTRDMPGFFLNTTAQAVELIADVGSPNLFVQYDVYHMHIMEGETIATLSRNLPLIKHIQIADHPGRHEPGTGEIAYAEIFKHIEATSYDGWIGAEYKPAGVTADGLGWMQTLNAGATSI